LKQPLKTGVLRRKLTERYTWIKWLCAVEKFSSQSKTDKKSGRTTGSGKVSAIPLPVKNRNIPATGHDSQPDALEKDLELLARLREQIDQLPDIDAAKIVQLHERIMRGEYQVNSKSLAGKLSDFESDL